MQIKMNSISRLSVQEFADQHQLTMEIHERSKREFPMLERYYAFFEACEVKEGSVLVGVFGNGETPEDAMKDYAEKISEKRLVFFAGDERRLRFELQAPILYFVVDSNQGQSS